ncbi:head decoration protein [Methylobacterium durans]|uniref:Head decoration protein n=1 Tax=Methylobacterium durans TaxID=2202825 RepID=A0A2U8WC28_9HYPH|nr:head decoration protein [Methylobacterium durans]AWN43161.1 head decoration protein [Methylobacterium durans]
MLASFTQEATFTADDGLVLSETVSRQITLVSGQNLKRGSVLGKITTGGKYTLALSASSDGSQVPAVILAEDCNASAGDKVTVAYFAGTFDENACTYGIGVTPATAREPLRDVSILLQSSITR